ncbi:molybdopterin-dependent oxidoreductase [Dasania marina]|uniref:molybdopterin-containing oxidoreductase family protein n=1 Tax=Dasania marina TaxID=471499 RepID=UPI0030D8FAAE|tara:strand:- start:4812 stop:6884 length:2073 start_codon:yes stop_codon:yes gene_type:complete
MTTIASDSIKKPAVCPLDCADTCSLSVEIEQGKLTKVRGSDANPFTRGKICSKVATGLVDQVHGQHRLTRPLRRVGAKGPGSTFEAITWQQALDSIYENFQQAIAEHGPQSIVPLSYGGPIGLLSSNSMNKRFLHKLGARKVTALPLCAGISDAAYSSLFGGVGGIPHDEMSHSKLIVIWGNNITACHLHLTNIIRDAQKQGAKLVVIDPKRIRIAEQADLHLAILPGTDVVLGYAVAAELNRLGALDNGFITRYVEGSESYLGEAKKYSLAMAAEICGVELASIQQFVNYWRDIKPASLSIGVGVERNRNGGSGIRTALALPVLTGNIGPAGAGICNTDSYAPLNDAALTRDDLYIGPDEEVSILDIPRFILQSDASKKSVPVKCLLINSHNPVSSHPRQRQMQAALARDDLFIVGCDITMTDSMYYADIILPAASHLEYSDITPAYGHTYLQRSQPAIEPVGEAVATTEVFRRLAQRFGFDSQEFKDSDEELIQQALDLSHPAMQGRSAADVSIRQALDCRHDGEGRQTPSLLRGQAPDTPSGRIELYSADLEQRYNQGLPQWQPLTTAHEFTLVSPSSEYRTNSIFGGVAGHDVDVVLEMHPKDAARLQLDDGQKVRVFNEQADVFLALKISDAVRPATVYTPKGAWLKGQHNTVNALIPDHKADIGGGACYNDAKVSVAALPNNNS